MVNEAAWGDDKATLNIATGHCLNEKSCHDGLDFIGEQESQETAT